MHHVAQNIKYGCNSTRISSIFHLYNIYICIIYIYYIYIYIIHIYYIDEYMYYVLFKTRVGVFYAI